MKTFYVGIPQTHFFGKIGVPVMVSRRTLERYRPIRPAGVPWALDSGGFTELTMHGGWVLRAAQYARLARSYVDVLGAPDFCAPQDWMCEPHMLQRTGLTVWDHQQRTVANYAELVACAPSLPWMPVLQGWSLRDYLVCLETYDRAGIDLRQAGRVGIGTLCRRQGSAQAATIVRALARQGLRLHGFGVKVSGLARVAPLLLSADSHAWNYRPPRRTPECCGAYAWCANCWRYAERWHGRVLASVAGPPERYAYQLEMDWGSQEGGG